MEQQIKEPTKDPEKLLCPKAGTATSSPVKELSSHLINTTQVAIWIKKNVHEKTTIKKVAKLLRHLE